MSNSPPIPRSRRRIASPPPLPLTPGEAETLLAAVQRIVRAADTPGTTPRPPEKKNPSRH